MADNRVVIRINYDRDRKRKELIDPKMVTVWHTGRIFGAIAILVVLVALFAFLISGGESEENESPDTKPIEQSVASSPEDIAPSPVEKQKMSSEAITVKSQSKFSKRPPAIIFDRRVIRASLNTAPRYGEPGDPIKPLVKIESGQSRELFYFSEVKKMQGQLMFHHWFKNGERVYKKQFTVKSNKAKLISSKKITDQDSGEWQVLLMDESGKHFSEVNFLVNP